MQWHFQVHKVALITINQHLITQDYLIRLLSSNPLLGLIQVIKVVKVLVAYPNLKEETFMGYLTINIFLEGRVLLIPLLPLHIPCKGHNTALVQLILHINLLRLQEYLSITGTKRSLISLLGDSTTKG